MREQLLRQVGLNQLPLGPLVGRGLSAQDWLWVVQPRIPTSPLRASSPWGLCLRGAPYDLPPQLPLRPTHQR